MRLVRYNGRRKWDEIRTLERDYGFTFQCHTWSHQTLAGPMIDESPKEERTEAWYRRELVESKAELERQLNLQPFNSSTFQPRVVDALCFPVGNFSDDVIRRCKAAGYKRLYASFPGNNEDVCNSTVHLHLDSPPSLIPRNLVQDYGLFDFKLALNGGMMAFYKRYYKLHKVDA